MDNEVAEIVTRIPELIDPGSDPIGARAQVGQLFSMLPKSRLRDRVTIEETQIAGPPGAPHVRLRIYKPCETISPAPALIFFHSSGFIINAPGMEDILCIPLCVGSGCIVISPDYRLAPENPFPAAVEDCDMALQWTISNAEKLGIDPGRIAVGGASAGGAIAAALTLRARDRGGPHIAFQLLIYAMLDDRLESLSARQCVNTPLNNRANCEGMWRAYLGGNKVVSSLAAPARAGDLSRLPPAYVLTAGLDPLRDEGIDYAVRMLRSGVPVELHQFADVPHGFDQVASDAVVSQRAINDYVSALRTALHSCG